MWRQWRQPAGPTRSFCKWPTRLCLDIVCPNRGTTSSWAVQWGRQWLQYFLETKKTIKLSSELDKSDQWSVGPYLYVSSRIFESEKRSTWANSFGQEWNRHRCPVDVRPSWPSLSWCLPWSRWSAEWDRQYRATRRQNRCCQSARTWGVDSFRTIGQFSNKCPSLRRHGTARLGRDVGKNREKCLNARSLAFSVDALFAHLGALIIWIWSWS